MRIAIFSTHPTFVTHLETELELAQEFIDNNNEVHFFRCNDKHIKFCDNILARSLSSSDSYENTSTWVCDFCMQRQSIGFNLLKGKYQTYPLISNEQKVFDYFIPNEYFENIERFKELKYDECFDIGWAIISSLISYTRNPEINLNEFKNEIQDLYSESIRVYETAKAILLKNEYDQVYIFNGRVSYARGLFRLTTKLKITTYIHERGCIPRMYELFENTTPHNISSYYERVNKYWLNANVLTRYRKGKKFFLNKIDGFGGSWESYTSKFQSDKLPIAYRTDNYNIVLFTSSEDEYVSIDNTWKNPFFKNQIECIEFLCNQIHLRNNPKEILYIRMHPNSKGMSKKYLEKMFSLQNYNNVEIIPPDSPINSYSLLFNSDKVITLGSTLTIESVFWGKPTILLTNCEFNQFKGPITPKNKNEIIDLCFNKKLPEPNKKDAIKIGYYLSNFGFDYKYYTPIDYKSGYFKGVNLSTGEVMQVKESFLKHKINVIKGFLFRLYNLRYKS